MRRVRFPAFVVAFVAVVGFTASQADAAPHPRLGARDRVRPDAPPARPDDAAEVDRRAARGPSRSRLEPGRALASAGRGRRAARVLRRRRAGRWPDGRRSPGRSGARTAIDDAGDPAGHSERELARPGRGVDRARDETRAAPALDLSQGRNAVTRGACVFANRAGIAKSRYEKTQRCAATSAAANL